MESTIPEGEQVINLRDLDYKVNLSQPARQKYNLIFDHNGGAECFYRHREVLINIVQIMISIALHPEKKSEILDDIRMTFVNTMRLGRHFIFYFANVSQDLFGKLDGGEGVFPIRSILNYKEWRKKERYMSVVKKFENKNESGTANMYEMGDKFQISILVDVVEGDEEDDKE